jgi:hypothetical protein
MVALALDSGAIRLRQDSGNFVRLKVRQLASGATLDWDTEHLRALRGNQWFLGRQETEETVECRKTAVTCSD